MNQEQNVDIMKNQQLNDTASGITFKDLYYIVLKNLIVIICIIAVCMVGGFVFTKLKKPVYNSTGTMLVSYEGSGTSISSDYTFSSYIANTFVVFITQDVVLDAVSQKTGVSVGVLKKNTTVKNSSLILSITYSCDNAVDAQNICQTIIDTAQEVADTMDDENKPVYHLLYDNLKVLSEAKEGTRKSETLKMVAISFAIGVVLASLYVFLNEVFNNKFKSSEEVERALGVPVLAGIPAYTFDDEEKDGKK